MQESELENQRYGTCFRIKVYLGLGILTLPVLLVSLWIFLMVYPLGPLNIGGLFLADDGKRENTLLGSAIKLLMHLVFATVSSWITLPCYTCAALEYLVFSCVPCIHMIIFCAYFQRYSLRHMNSELNNFVKIWREVQIILAIYNYIHKGTLNHVLTGLASSGFIVGSYCLFGLGNCLTWIQFLMFALVVFDCSVATLDAGEGVKGKLYSVSGMCLKRIKHEIGPNQKFRCRYLSSFNKLKIYLGHSNFYDEITPLNVIQFNACQTVNLLLL